MAYCYSYLCEVGDKELHPLLPLRVQRVKNIMSHHHLQRERERKRDYNITTNLKLRENSLKVHSKYLIIGVDIIRYVYTFFLLASTRQ